MGKTVCLSEEAFEKERKKKISEIEASLKSLLPGEISLQKTISDAMEYSLMGGGKRLRPMFMKESYFMFSGTEDYVINRFMAAIEMIHTYSLVHDDLPAMDDDAYRRGRKTTHIVYGEDIGILTGDALLNYAYETALSGAGMADKKEDAIRALSILAKKAGIYGMAGGQTVDVEMTGKALTKEQVLFIYHLKTGALLEAALMTGAALAGASEEDVQKLEKIGECVGMAFQIQDDILDIISTTEELGKPVHSDDRNGKTTYVTLFGMEKAKQAVKEYSEQAVETLQELFLQMHVRENVFLYTLIQKLVDRKK